MDENVERYKMMLHDSNREARDRRKKIKVLEQRLDQMKSQLAKRDETIAELQGKVQEYEDTIVELDDVRLDLETRLNDVPQELEDFRRESFLNQHKEAFKEALGETGLHPQARLEQIWQMVGYDPFEVEELTPDVVNQVISVAKQEAPFLFMGRDVSQVVPQQGGYQTGSQVASIAAASGFVQPNGFLQSGNVGQPNVRPSQPRSQQLNPPQGWSGVAARGVPIQPQPQAIQGRFRDPKWVAENRQAITEAVERGATFISTD